MFLKRFLWALIALSLSPVAFAQNYNFNIGGLQYASGPAVPGSCSQDGSYFFKNTAPKGWSSCSGGVYVSAATGGISNSFTAATAGGAAPSPLLTSECPATVNPTMYVQDVNGDWHTQAGVDPLDSNFSPAGTLLFCRRTWFVDGGQTPTPFSNSFVVVAHAAGTGVAVTTNQDRAMSISWKNPTDDTASRYGAEGLQIEMDVRGSPVWTGSPDGEASSLSVQMSDSHVGPLTAPSLGTNGIRINTFRQSGAGAWGSCSGCMTGVRSLISNASTVDGAGMIMVAGYFAASSLPGAVNLNGAGIQIIAPSSHQFTNTWGVLIGDHGTSATDYNFRSDSSAMNSGYNWFQGPTMFGKEIRTARAGGSAPGNTDTAGVLAYASAITASYTFLNTANTAAPVCVISPISPGATTFAITTLNATTLTVTASGTFTGSVNYACVARN